MPVSESPSIQLTAEQEAIIQAEPGHYVITAVAGSGKTTTLSYRIKHLLKEGFDHRRVLVLMFNKAAQLDFTAKLQSIIPQEQAKPEVRTFHAMGYRLYQRFVQEGYLKPFKRNIISEKELQFQLWRLINQHVDKDQLKEIKRNKKEVLSLCIQFIDAVKSSLKSPDLVFDELELESKFDYFIDLFHQFESWRQDNARISYADMLYDPVRAIRQYPDLLQLVSNKMDVILVDEYQDTNDIQHELLKIIAGDRALVTVVGDPDQTIYEFRGAKPEYIIQGFSSDFKGAKDLHLSYSFRYGHTVALLANHLITRNTGRKNLLSKAHPSNPDTAVSLRFGSVALIDQLKELGKNELSEAAVLVRVWSQTVSLELGLLESGIPYKIEGHPGIFYSDEMGAIISLLEIATGQLGQFSPEDRSLKLERLFKFPHIGVAEGQTRQIAFTIAQHPRAWGKILMEQPLGELKKIQSIKLERLAMALALTENSKRSVHEILARYTEQTELYEGIRSLSLSHDQAEEKVASIEGIIRFVSALKGAPAQVLAHLYELKQAAFLQQQQTDQNALTISTIHRAKGLEWQHVYVPDLQDKIYPYVHRQEAKRGNAGAPAIGLPTDYIESERRLLYVAITRAIGTLHLFVPDKNNRTARPSRFYKELNIEACQKHGQNLACGPATDDLKGASHELISRYVEECSDALEPA